MKLRNLLVLTITLALAALCAQAQESEGARTFTDHLGQSITISRFGTVLSFKDSKGLQNATDHAFRICPACGDNKCIDSRRALTDGTSVELKVKFPEHGDTIRKNKTIIATATVRQGALTLTRQVTWRAGARVVIIDETISVSNVIAASTWGAIGDGGSVDGTISVPSFVGIGSNRESGGSLIIFNKPCPIPPGTKDRFCPPEMADYFLVSAGTIVSTKPLMIRSGKSLVTKFAYRISLKAP